MSGSRHGAVGEGLDILFVGPLPPYPTGAALVCAEVLDGLARLGHRIRAVAPLAPTSAARGHPFGARAEAIEILPFGVPYYEAFAHAAPDDYRAAEGRQLRKRLDALLCQARPDVIVIGREIYAWHVTDIARAHRLPTVMLSHGGPSTAIVNGAWPERRARQLLERFRQVDLTVSVASHWAERLRALGLENVVVIPNPIDLRRFAPGPRDVELQRSLRIGPEAVVVLHASSLQAEKRPFDLVAAAEKASRQVPQLTYVVLGETMVGPRGPADVSPRREMEAACRRAGLAERFRFVGWVDHDRVREYLRLADLVVMPSEHETQSLVYLETQACGRVVVASDIPGAREVIVDGVTGLLFRRGDVADLAARIVSAARDPALRTRIGLNARQAVRTHDLGATIAAYAATLVRVAAKRPQLSPS